MGGGVGEVVREREPERLLAGWCWEGQEEARILKIMYEDGPAPGLVLFNGPCCSAC